MKTDEVLEIKDLAKIYRIYENPGYRLWEIVLNERMKLHKEFQALDSISFSIKKGESLGIVGRNGSGKSTLLQIIAGILKASSGSMCVRGKVSALLELGSGFHGYFTGRENIYMSGAVAGMSRAEIDGKIGEIRDFADLGDFFDRPIRLYSKGMMARLGFAVSVTGDPDIFIVDEALAVGDIKFRAKCYRKFEDLIDRGKTVILVSHSSDDLLRICDNSIWLEKGSIQSYGKTKRVVEEYQSFMMHNSFLTGGPGKIDKGGSQGIVKNLLSEIPEKTLVTGDRGASIRAIGFFNSDGESISVLSGRQSVKLVIRFKAEKAIDDPYVLFYITDAKGLCVLSSSNIVSGKRPRGIAEGATVETSFRFTFPDINKGIYFISAEINSGTVREHVRHCRALDIYEFSFRSDDIWQHQAGLWKIHDCSFEIEYCSD